MYTAQLLVREVAGSAIAAAASPTPLFIKPAIRPNNNAGLADGGSYEPFNPKNK
jgi:hypothetical protein